MTATLNRPSPIAAPAVAEQAPIPMSRLLRVEWDKATDTRAARWLIALTAAATVLIMLLPLLNQGVDQTYQSYLRFPALALTALLPVVSIMTLTSEWTQRTVLSTFVQEPRRSRVIQAKVFVSLAMAGVAIVFGAVVTAAAVAIAAASGRDLTADMTTAAVIGFVLFVLLNMLMGVAFGALLHNTAASIVLFFILPVAFTILGSAVQSVGEWIDPTTTFDWVQQGEWDGHVAKIVTSVLLWVAIPLTAGLLRTARREIK